MRQHHSAGLAGSILGLCLAAGLLRAEQAVAPPIPAQEQPEILTRGPVHEAFAEPINLDLHAGLVVQLQPPPNIAELPPAERPAGDQFVWVPGYWSWDGDRNNYVWVSACWRVAPPGMSWVPGYWGAVSGGWEWVAGFWTPAGAQEIEYLPAPPAMEDVAPSAAPSADYIWVPSCYYWGQDGYRRRAGYWLAAQQGWVWAPSHYVRTPRGYVFCAGHWDYALEDRGMLFAPVYFPASMYGRAGFTYAPSIVIDLGVLRGSLFAYPRYSHYYFGDYYDDAYIRIGIYPWFDGERLQMWYDPIYQYDRWHYRRTEPRWEERERHEYDVRHADRDLRPARTYREMETRLARVDEPKRKDIRMAQSLTVVVANKGSSLKFEQINPVARQKIVEQATEVHKFREQRSQWESSAATDGKRGPAPAERKQAAIPPADRRQSAMPPTERKEAATPLTEHRLPAASPTETNRVQTPTEHKEATAPPIERRRPVSPPTEVKKVPVPAEHKAPAASPIERKAAELPREIQGKQPERVKIPAPPVAGRPSAPGDAGKGPPDRPADEHKGSADGKDSRRDEGRNRNN